MACTPNICAILGTVSTLTVASDHLPPSLAARLARESPNWMLASLRGDHSRTTTGTWLERTSTSASRLASVISTPPEGPDGPAAPPSPAGARCLSAERSTAPAMDAATGRGRVTPTSLSCRFGCVPPRLRHRCGTRHGAHLAGAFGPYEEDHTAQRHDARQQRQQPGTRRPFERNAREQTHHHERDEDQPVCHSEHFDADLGSRAAEVLEVHADQQTNPTDGLEQSH